MATPIAGFLLLAVGLRVLLRWRAQRSLPEAMVGVWLIACGIGVVPLRIASGPGSVAPAEASLWLVPAHLLITTGFSALAVFVWLTFGADTWRRALAAGLVIAQWVSLAALGLLDGYTQTPPRFVLVVVLLRAAVVGWAFVETARYARMMERRVQLGLADPVVANRFTLWSIWTGSMCVVVTSVVGMRVLQARFQSGAGALDPNAVGAVLFPLLACLGVLAAGAMALAFFPPEAYRRWLARRARPGAGTAPHPA